MIEEGKVSVEVSGNIFYNPRMEMNRDITVVCLESLPEVTTYVDAMAASGIRGIRIKKEVSHPIEVTINDWDTAACELIKRNAEQNNVQVNVSELRREHAAFSHAIRFCRYRSLRHAGAIY